MLATDPIAKSLNACMHVYTVKTRGAASSALLEFPLFVLRAHPIADVRRREEEVGRPRRSVQLCARHDDDEDEDEDLLLLLLLLRLPRARATAEVRYVGEDTRV